MRLIPPLAILASLFLALPPVMADVPSSQTKRYVGPFSGANPCWLPQESMDVNVGGACFVLNQPGYKFHIDIDDATGSEKRVVGHFDVYSASGELLSTGDFCGDVTTSPIRERAILGVSIYPGVYLTGCPEGAATGTTGTITVSPKSG